MPDIGGKVKWTTINCAKGNWKGVLLDNLFQGSKQKGVWSQIRKKGMIFHPDNTRLVLFRDQTMNFIVCLKGLHSFARYWPLQIIYSTLYRIYLMEIFFFLSMTGKRQLMKLFADREKKKQNRKKTFLEDGIMKFTER